MERDPHRRAGRLDRADRIPQPKVTPIVDDTESSCPLFPLCWLWSHLRCMIPANNPHYTPTLPPAA